LCGGGSRGGKQKGKEPDGRGCDALRAFGQSMSPRGLPTSRDMCGCVPAEESRR
jgi:hypothetical protein